MWKWILFCLIFPLSLFGQKYDSMCVWSLPDAHHCLLQRNRSLKLAKIQVRLAQEERKGVLSAWYPSLLASGTALRFSSDVRVGLPDAQWISSLMDKLGVTSFTFPLLDRQLSSTGLTLVWPAFTGGKRLYAERMGRLAEQMAVVETSQRESELWVELVKTYYALRLSERVLAVRLQTYQSMLRHEREALLMIQSGFITKTDGLYVKIGVEEAFKEWRAAEQQHRLCQQAFSNLLTLHASPPVIESLTTSTALFINKELPVATQFKSLTSFSNYSLSLLELQGNVLKNQWKMAKSDYWPEVVLFGQQTLYAYHLPKNLVPRSVVGIGFTWNLFDGGRREASIRSAKVRMEAVKEQREKTSADLDLLVDQLYNELQQAQEAMQPLQTSLLLCRELARMCRQRFKEGMATSTEVVDAETRLSTVEVALLNNLFLYDVCLAQLLSVCGRSEEYWTYAQQGEKEENL